MKRFFFAMLVSGLIVGAAEAKGSTGATRTVQTSYYGAQVLYEYRVCTQSGAAGCITLQTQPGEGSLTAKVTDAHGQPVSVWVVDASEPRTDLDGPEGVYGTFCGETTRPISFTPGATLEFWVGGDWWPDRWSDPLWMVPKGWDCGPRAGTTGTLNITLTS